MERSVVTVDYALSKEGMFFLLEDGRVGFAERPTQKIYDAGLAPFREDRPDGGVGVISRPAPVYENLHTAEVAVQRFFEGMFSPGAIPGEGVLSMAPPPPGVVRKTQRFQERWVEPCDGQGEVSSVDTLSAYFWCRESREIKTVTWYLSRPRTITAGDDYLSSSEVVQNLLRKKGGEGGL